MEKNKFDFFKILFKELTTINKMQLTSIQDLSPQSIIFKEAKEYKVKDSKIKYKRIPIETVYHNGNKGPLVIETPFLFSFGVTEKKDQSTNKLVGYSIPVCLWEKDSSPNLKEEQFYKFICKITEICQQHLEDEYGPEIASSLSDPLYYKQIEYTDKKGKKKTKKDSSAAPVLYAKLIYSDKLKKILSLFNVKGKKKVNPFNYLNQYCNVKMALVIEGIFMSKTVTSLQIKVHECYIKELKPRESLLKIDEDEDQEKNTLDYSESEEDEEDEDMENIRDLIVSEKEEVENDGQNPTE